jgi:hypothetical protein
LHGPPLWSSGQSSWLQIQRSGFDSLCYQIFLDVVSPEQGPFSLVNTIEEILERKGSGLGLKSREYGRRYVTLTIWHPLSANLALTSLTSGGGSVGIVRSRTQAKKFSSV